MKIGTYPYPHLAVFSAAFLFLSVLLNIAYPAGHLFTWRLLLPSIDVLFLFIPLAVAACWGRRALLLTSLPTWVLFLILRLFRIGDTVVPMYLDRPFNLYIDSGYLFGLYDLLKTSSHGYDFLLMSAGAAGAALGICVSSWYAWQSAAKALMVGRIRRIILGVSGLLLGFALVWGPGITGSSILVHFIQEIFSIRQQLEQQQSFAARLERTIKDRGTAPASLNGLEGADVLLFVVESYGRTVFSNPAYRQTMSATLSRFAKTLDQHGFSAVSSYLVSPTYGGSSWLAHDTLESGLKVSNDLESTVLLRSSLPPLAASFRRTGYRTVSVMPGTRFAFPEGAYFGYEQVYYASHFNYRGPTFGWAPMPDQFVLDWVRRHEFITRKQPLFVCYVLISSHASFNVQPPYIADWDEIGNGSIYNSRQPVLFPVYWPDLTNAGDAYMHSLDYEFTTLGDYLVRYVTTDTLIIIIGDHQPNLQLTAPEEPWSVPIHVISRNSCLLDPFRKRGYTSGLLPAQPLPHAGMETFSPEFLKDFE